ncbi:MAG: cytochrome c oxidase subunit 3 [Sporichthyaceae bacterium]
MAAPPSTRRLPGVDGLWVFIGFDAAIFALLFGTFLHARHGEPELFEASRQTLNQNLGGANTLVLLTSSWLVALAVAAMRRREHARASRLLLAGAAAGGLFVALKATEYGIKLADGIPPGSGAFFTWYFVLTGIHLAHVVAGTGLLVFAWRRSVGRNVVVVESVASFWHLVDLLWIVIFPLLYLQR